MPTRHNQQHSHAGILNNGIVKQHPVRNQQQRQPSKLQIKPRGRSIPKRLISETLNEDLFDPELAYFNNDIQVS